LIAKRMLLSMRSEAEQEGCIERGQAVLKAR
jgi:hypothetical protein